MGVVRASRFGLRAHSLRKRTTVAPEQSTSVRSTQHIQLSAHARRKFKQNREAFLPGSCLARKLRWAGARPPCSAPKLHPKTQQKLTDRVSQTTRKRMERPKRYL